MADFDAAAEALHAELKVLTDSQSAGVFRLTDGDSEPGELSLQRHAGCRSVEHSGGRGSGARLLLRSIVQPIQRVSETLAESAKQTHLASEEISTASQSLAEGASEQAASWRKRAHSLEELASMASRNTESAQRAKQLGDEARGAADAGVASIQVMGQAIEIQASGRECVRRLTE